MLIYPLSPYVISILKSFKTIKEFKSFKTFKEFQDIQRVTFHCNQQIIYAPFTRYSLYRSSSKQSNG